MGLPGALRPRMSKPTVTWTYRTDRSPFTGEPQGLFRFPEPVDREPQYLKDDGTWVPSPALVRYAWGDEIAEELTPKEARAQARRICGRDVPLEQ